MLVYMSIADAEEEVELGTTVGVALHPIERQIGTVCHEVAQKSQSELPVKC